ncbi:hypothetical protein [Aquipuribacter sp. SD81]|uniref:hypothetical protein n=1 Tax=Aquipuribacter sp. SD81 TaxID=3127703 RepID=UPI003015BFB4
MSTTRTLAWRLALVAGGLAMAAGGALHPESDGADPLREELAVMTADPAWVPGHALTTVGTVLVVLGLWSVLRAGLWPTAVRRLLLVTTVVWALYVVETVMHLASAVDAHALAHGGAAPVAFTHIGLAAVLYPLSGLALATLALGLGRAWGGWRWLLAVPGVVGGLAHAVSVPLTLVLPTAELSPFFAVGGILTALWAVATGLGGRQERPAAVSGTPVPRVARAAVA